MNQNNFEKKQAKGKDIYNLISKLTKKAQGSRYYNINIRRDIQINEIISSTSLK